MPAELQWMKQLVSTSVAMTVRIHCCGGILNDSTLMIPAIFLALWWQLVGIQYVPIQSRISVSGTVDFQIDGTGQSAAWDQATWIDLSVQENAGDGYSTQIKLLYSATGIYFLFQCEDRKMTATIKEDFGSLFKEDVVEVFLQPDPG